MANKTYKVLLEKLGGTNATTYVGNEGELFFDPTTTTLRVADGTTQGGSVVSGGGNADLGDFRISGSTLGTQGEDGGWGDTGINLDPGGESYAGIQIPNVNDQQNGSPLNIYNSDADGGGIQLLTHNNTWQFNNGGTITFPNSTMKSESDTLTIENFNRRSQLKLDENNDRTRLSQWSGQRSDYFTSADWVTGTYVADEGGGYVTFTGATNILNWLNSVPYADRISLVINDNYDVDIPTTGYSAGDGAITFYVTIAPNTSPTTVTSVDIRYYYESMFEMDYDDEEILLRGVDCDINLTTVQAGNIDVNSIDNLSLRGFGLFSLRNQSNNNGIVIQTDDGNKNWYFEVDGSFELPSGGKIVGQTTDYSGHMAWVGESSGDGLGYSTLKLVPSNNLESSDQYIILDPTAPGHIHIRAGGTQDNSDANLYLGGENSYVKISSGVNPPVQVTSNNQVWQFGTDGVLVFPDSSSQTGGAISIAELKTLVAASTNFADFQTRIAAL